MSDHDRDALTENVVRYRTAAVLCFAIAVFLAAAVVALRPHRQLAGDLASLGMAWWLVGSGLVPLTFYWVWRRAQNE